MSASPSVSYSITVRLEAPSYGNAVSGITRAVEDAGGVVTGLDVSGSGRDLSRRAGAPTLRGVSTITVTIWSALSGLFVTGRLC